MNETFSVGKYTFTSRLLLGTGKFSSLELMSQVVRRSRPALVTMALRRAEAREDDFYRELKSALDEMGSLCLPNTSGARSAKEAVLAAKLAREAFGSDLVKLEIHPDPIYLLPDPIETLIAAKELVADGFTVFPYINIDPVLCKRLEDVGCQCVMPLAAEIGSNHGISNPRMMEIIITNSNVPVIIDAGLGMPSHAAAAMEMGASAVLINTAIATAQDPMLMADAFNGAIRAGRLGYEIGGKVQSEMATSPLTQFLAASNL